MTGSCHRRDNPQVTEGGKASLGAFGVSADADLVWQVLLRWPDLGRGALCQRAGIDDERVEAAIEELGHRGFVEPAPTALGLAPVDPAIVINHAVAIEQRDLAARLSQLSDLRAHLPALAHEYAQGRQRIDAKLPIEVVTGLEATRMRLLLLSRSVRHESMSIEVHNSPKARAIALPDDLA